MLKAIRVSSLLHLTNIARCHMASFPTSFSTKLGLAYNIKSFEWFLAGNNKFLYCIEDNGMVAGYCGGFQSTGIGDGSTSGMMRYAMKQAALGMIRNPLLFFNKDVIRFYPLIIKNVFKQLGFGKKILLAEKAAPITPVAIGLVVIGVHPDYRGKGYFEILMKSFEEESIKRNATKMLLSVKPSNLRAVAAYKKVGWQIEKHAPQALEMYKYISNE